MSAVAMGNPVGVPQTPPKRAARLVVAALMCAGCVPEIDDTVSRITGPTLLAISSTPAEAAPPDKVTFKALYVDTKGTATAPMEWSFCTAREALTDEGTVSPACLASSGADLVDIGSGASAAGALPAESCRLFGPDVPDALPGQPAGRPVDPDATGGFYQPVRLLVNEGASPTSIGATRIACGLQGAPADVTTAFASGYRMNEAPAIASLSVVHASGASEPIASAKVKTGEAVTFHATWATCPEAPKAGCTGSESYLLFDPEARALTSVREAIRVDWFSTGGALADDSDGRSSSEADTPSVDNGWTAPSAAGTVLLWLVIRDDRGGVGWESYQVSVGE